MTRRVAVFTGTRAEYGLLYWLMKEIEGSAHLELQVIASCMHLSPEFGETWQQIVQDGFQIDAKVEMLLSSNTDVGTVKSMGIGTLGFADALDRLRPDLLVVLGDRFEALSIAQAALIMRIPIVHLHGGELTEGAYDDAIRHAITKMAYLHFVAAEPYRDRVIQMGESPERVFNVGAVGLDHLARTPPMSLEALRESLDFDLSKPFLLVTYHPVTVLNEDPVNSFEALLQALEMFPAYQVVITYPNADNGGRAIIPMIEKFAVLHKERVLVVPSLGFRRYLSVAGRAAAVVGNSSSGVIEVPSFGVPTVNIGSRQAGRLCADSIVHCEADKQSIVGALSKVLEESFTQASRKTVNPYGRGDAARSIVGILENCDLSGHKSFHDLS
ncbi:UNVERIFIED_ORG: UDP-N-acetylglucosamine 2-epimerase (non-hydrolyzing) [Pseudomonas lini]|uniref:UDP-N-acetylglucosamine 2-epimerase n=1 Tax=Pseudomonas viciae TaxID=2505979 RepID=A0A4P7PE83_9PSED|nr:UDP-N-acetylglucosamine 2-epimerase [Pseudomonas viciae]QBZ88745.1 UDP-N-acetylglucosamine 2-epimerase (hydrolyzing) [Pseudomonas viciae]UZE88091.1 UDP-N-acetylglucosamine 2-epimerase [Pseudomonas viciae]WGO95071.1 UDP-N-acetylglucosamine 2-epimerase [Pseudomonas viciae]